MTLELSHDDLYHLYNALHTHRTCKAFKSEYEDEVEELHERIEDAYRQSRDSK